VNLVRKARIAFNKRNVRLGHFKMAVYCVLSSQSTYKAVSGCAFARINERYYLVGGTLSLDFESLNSQRATL
jgi:hypothetical protein